MTPLPALRLLGPPDWRRPDGTTHGLGPERRHQLLALLGYEARWVGRDRLAALFWPERPERAARANLRKVLHELRTLGIEGLEEGAEGLRWCPASDVEAFRRAWQRADWPLAAEAGAGCLMQGLDDGLGGTAFGDWLRDERLRWHRGWREAALKAAASGDAAQAFAMARRLLEADGLDEAAMALALQAAAALRRPELAAPLWQAHRQRLHDELGAPPSPALQALANAESAPGLAPLSPLIGREAEMQTLAGHLAAGRLVTLRGPGGVGKTHLARHAAGELAARFAHGVAFVALEDVGTPAELPACLAAALGLPDAGAGDTWARLARELAPQSRLLVLDGFEMLIDAGPQLLQLLAAAPGLRLLLTSRERLGLEGEWLLPLAGLPVPGPADAGAAALATPAARLFVQRAQAVQPGFDAAACWRDVAAVCRQVDGLPLALQLAAAWVRVLPASAVAAELEGDLALLDAGHEADLGRVFTRSWALLATPERQALARLAVFHGGFTRAAASEVAGVDLPLLAALVDKSMLLQPAPARFALPAWARPRALQQLLALPDAPRLQAAHSRWYLQRLQPPAHPWIDDIDNLRAAWLHAVAERDGAAVGAALPVLPWAGMLRGRLDEASRLLEEAGRAFAGDPLRAALLAAQRAWILLWQGQRAAASTLASAALVPLREAAHAAGVVMALRTLGHAARLEGRHAEAADHLAAAVSEARRAGLARLEATMQDGLAMALNMLGRHDEARRALAAAEALHGGADAVQQAYNHFNRSQSHSLAGEAALALPWAEQALAMSARSGHVVFIPHARLELARVLRALGREEPARALAHAALQESADLQDPAMQAAAHELLARLAQARNDEAEARARVRDALRLCLQHGQAPVGAQVAATSLALAPAPLRARTLAALRRLPEVQAPVRADLREEGAIAAAPAPPSLQHLLAELLAAL